MAEPTYPFESLDYLYTPSADVASDARHIVSVLGAELAFAIESDGIRVAMLHLSATPPAILLTDHLEGESPILVYRVANLAEATASLTARGWAAVRTLELPPGPAASFTTPGGQRIAIYEALRPFVVESFLGRRDFEV